MSFHAYLTNIVTFIFLLIVLSYYVLLFKRAKVPRGKKKFKSITIIIPSHNEEPYIAESIQAVLDADFQGKKEIIVIDDGSEDNTYAIAKRFPVKVLKQQHCGKSRSINRALKLAKGELIAIVDGDSCIQKDSLVEAIPYLREKKVAVVCATVKVKNEKSLLGMWLHIEQLYNSLLRGLFTKMNVNIVTPGPLSIYKKDAIAHLGGFETRGFSEDVDIAVRLIKAGYKVEYAAKSVTETYMPIRPRGFWRQRNRFAKGWINILKRHLRLNKTFIEIYTLPLALFWYVQAVIMGSTLLYTLFSGYNLYFISKGVLFSGAVIRYFFEWLSVVGLLKWFWAILTGVVPLTIPDLISLAASLLTYPLFLLAVFRYDKKFTLWHLIPLLFMFPFWLLIMLIYIINIPEYFNEKQLNIWEK